MYTFAVLVALGTVLGLAWVALRVSENRQVATLDAGLWALTGGLLAGRAGFVIAAWPHFQAHPLEIPQVWLGGFSGPGSILGAVLALGLAASLGALPLGRIADDLLPLALPVVLSVWIGCWLTGSAYGLPAQGWWALPARDEWGQVSARWPVQLLGALLTLLLFFLLDLLQKRFSWMKQPGRISIVALLGLSLELFGLSYLRADPVQVWRGLRLDAWAALGLLGVALAVLLINLIWSAYETYPGSRSNQHLPGSS